MSRSSKSFSSVDETVASSRSSLRPTMTTTRTTSWRRPTTTTTSTTVLRVKQDNDRLLAQNKKLLVELEKTSRWLAEAPDARKSPVALARIPDASSSEAPLVALRSELEEAGAELEDERRVRAMAEKQRDEALKSVEDLKESLVEARNKWKDRVRRLQSESEQKAVALDHVEAEAARLSADLDAARVEAASSDERWRRDWEVESRRSEESAANLAATLRDLETTRAEVEALKDELAHAETLNGSSKRKGLSGSSSGALRGDVDSGLGSFSSEFRLRIARKEAEWSRKPKIQDDEDSSSVNEDDFRSEIRRLVDESKRGQARLREIETLAAESKRGQTRLREMEALVQSMQDERNQLRCTVDKLEESGEEAKRQLRLQEDELNKRSAELQQRDDRLKNRAVHLQQQEEQIENLSSQLRLMLKEAEELKQEARLVETESEGRRKEMEKLRRKLQEIGNEKDEMQRKEEELRRNKEEMIKEKEEMTSKETEMTTTIERLMKEKENIEKEAKIARAESTAANSEISLLREDFAARRLQADEAAAAGAARLQTLQRALARTRQELADAESRMEANEEASRAAREEQTAAEKEAENKIVQLERLVRESAEDRRAAERRGDSVAADLAVAVEEGRRLSVALDEFKRSAEEAKADITAARAKAKEAEFEAAATKEKLKEATRSITEIRRSKDELERKIKIEAKETEDRLQHLLSAAEEEARSAKAQHFADAEDRRRSLQTRVTLLEDAEARATALESRAAELEAALERRSQDVAELDAALGRQREEEAQRRARAESNLIEARAALEDRGRALVNAEGLATRAEAAAEQERTERAAAEARILEMKSLMESSERDSLAKSRELECLVRERDDLLETLRVKTEASEKTERVVDEQRRGMKQHAAQIAEMDAAIRERRVADAGAIAGLEAELASSLGLREKAERDAEEMRAILRERDSTIEVLTETGERSRSEILALRGRIKQLDDSFASLTNEKRDLSQESRLLKEELQERHQRLLESTQDLRQMAAATSALEKQLDTVLQERAEASRLAAGAAADETRKAHLLKEEEMKREIRRLNFSMESLAEGHRATLADRDRRISAAAAETEALKQRKSQLEEKLLDSQQLMAGLKQELLIRMGGSSEGGEERPQRREGEGVKAPTAVVGVAGLVGASDALAAYMVGQIDDPRSLSRRLPSSNEASSPESRIAEEGFRKSISLSAKSTPLGTTASGTRVFVRSASADAAAAAAAATPPGVKVANARPRRDSSSSSEADAETAAVAAAKRLEQLESQLKETSKKRRDVDDRLKGILRKRGK